MRSEQQANMAIEQYADLIKRICFIHLKNPHDTEDIFQNVFLKYVLYPHAFQDCKHEKAWLIRVAVNECKDLLKSFYRKNVSIDTIEERSFEPEEEHRELLELVLKLPPKYKEVIYLFYYENYTASEIGRILKKNENTIYTWLSRAKKILKEQLGGEGFE